MKDVTAEVLGSICKRSGVDIFVWNVKKKTNMETDTYESND
jgi:hypothetical protein